MKTLLKIIGYAVGAVVVVVALTLVAARFTDGPMEIIAGGPFSSGEPSANETDWSFLKDYETVEFQLLDPARSRTTWIVEHDNRLFIPCGYMNSTWGRIWKQWPLQAEQDGRAILRVDGKLYDLQLVRIKEDPALDFVLSELGRKYLGGADGVALGGREQVADNSLWIFELTARS